MKKSTNKGFTLIELLVVIAIIGILSAVVLASLNQARTKARDASTQASMSSVRAQAEIHFDTAGGTYTGLAADPQIVALVAAVNAQIPAAATNLLTVTADAYTYAVTLNSGVFFCVDSTGYSGRIAAAAPASAGVACR